MIRALQSPWNGPGSIGDSQYHVYIVGKETLACTRPLNLQALTLNLIFDIVECLPRYLRREIKVTQTLPDNLVRRGGHLWQGRDPHFLVRPSRFNFIGSEHAPITHPERVVFALVFHLSD